MHLLFNINLCKLFFVIITSSLVILGVLINFFEPHLPAFIKKTFRYGKFASDEKSLLVQSVEVPKSYFRHFYVAAAFIFCPIFLKEVVAVYVFNKGVDDWIETLLNFSCGYGRLSTVPAHRVLIASILLSLQIFRRFYDTHFVSVFSENAMINLSHYLIGMAFYPAVMLIILSEAPKFAQNVETNTTTFNLSEIMFNFFIIVVFLWAWYHQHVATVILANLRKNKKGDVVDQGYRLPEGDWFNYLSSPHSTAEIIMYTALTLLLAKNTSWLYVYAWILSNQIETILLSHWWYLDRFKNFPPQRKALIPFIY
ncbi:polyprenol reductase isoform X2 [Tribolium castaneum]|nr:PREDICTED: polyprenol reductase isoform X2 [Tribolium castaneum]|eukprot:XP_008191881.1 PREDICTED: polyprenol reductase isoform X2 [Tribolium castaneum]